VGAFVLIGSRTASGLLFAWALAMVVSLVVCMPMLRLEPTPTGEGNLSHRVALTRRYGGLSFRHHVLNLSINSIGYIVALIAALLISPQQLAYFSTALLLSSTAMIIPYLLALSLFAEISGDQSLLHRHVRRTLPLGLALSGGILVVVAVAAPLVMRIFGPAYVVNGTTAYWGMTGLCVGWTLGAWCEAVFLLPAVLRVFHEDHPAEPGPGGASG